MEIHITGDIATATQFYMQATNDTQWYSQAGGKQLIEDMAAFW